MICARSVWIHGCGAANVSFFLRCYSGSFPSCIRGPKCSPASPCVQRLVINTDHPSCNRTQPWTDFMCVRVCCMLPFLHYLGSRFRGVGMMRRCAQMPSPFFIPSTAERLCCLTAPTAERSAYLTQMGLSVIRPGSDLLHRRSAGSLSAISKQHENKGAYCAARVSEDGTSVRAGWTRLSAFCPTHLSPGAVRHSLIEGLSAAQVEAISTEREEADAHFSVLWRLFLDRQAFPAFLQCSDSLMRRSGWPARSRLPWTSSPPELILQKLSDA